MKKRVFSVLLALVLMLCAVPLPVHAAANEITSTTGASTFPTARTTALT